ncbi:MAG: VOC family protein [Kutzneria sp.]|nr:VOC family protein [Kutzneria sp.]MBV9846272.1 VOC family protein [Kutzneria sp.]
MKPVTWFSIPADDMARALSFYEKAFGWKILPETVEPDPVYNYHVTLNSASNEKSRPVVAGTVNGCIVNRDIGLAHPAVLVRVDDLGEAVRGVVAAGGTTATEVTPMVSLNGTFVLVRDTEGNLVELFAEDR